MFKIFRLMKIRQAKKIMKGSYRSPRRYKKHPWLYFQEMPNVDGYWQRTMGNLHRDHRIAKAISLIRQRLFS